MSILEKVIGSDGDVYLRVYAKNSCRHSTRHYEAYTGDEEEQPEVFPEEAEDTIFNLLISSKVLSVASPVFKAMFYGRFREGIELAESRVASVVYAQELPEDSADAMINLCFLLHAKLDEV
ncbi:hypothetical protein GE09DRAFT_1095428, partial [Coniochaeta sp. 2T2.1]